jgi:murein DD-endopeptidase MepM/ murein hydrolase activator NlpD
VRGASPAPGWQRRIYRHPEFDGGRAWLRRLVTSLRVLVITLAVTGCAFEPSQSLRGPHGTADTPMADPMPEPPAIVSRFGDWGGGGGMPRPWQHSGIDIRGSLGSPVLAAADGVVLRTGWGPFAGRYVLVKHASDLTTAYYHLSAITVATGQKLLRGDQLGRVGMTGNANGPHLHFGVCRRPDGQCGSRIGDGWVNPEQAWAAPNPCLVPGRPVPSDPRRLTYPVPCSS